MIELGGAPTNDTDRLVHIARADQPQLAVRVTGDHPQVLLVHGAAGAAAIWSAVLPALAQLGIQAAALDLRGHGFSEGHETLQRWRIEDYVADVHAALRRWDTLRILVGHSMGGLVAQLAAAEARLDRLVLIASSPTEGMLRSGFLMTIAHPWTFAAVAFSRRLKRLYQSPRVARSLLFHPDTPPDVADRWIETLQEESWRAALQLTTLRPDPGQIACPVTVIAGECDRMVDRRASERTARDYSTQLVTLAGCAHMIPCEAEPLELARVIVGDRLAERDLNASPAPAPRA